MGHIMHDLAKAQTIWKEINHDLSICAIFAPELLQCAVRGKESPNSASREPLREDIDKLGEDANLP